MYQEWCLINNKTSIPRAQTYRYLSIPPTKTSINRYDNIGDMADSIRKFRIGGEEDALTKEAWKKRVVELCAHDKNAGLSWQQVCLNEKVVEPDSQVDRLVRSFLLSSVTFDEFFRDSISNIGSNDDQKASWDLAELVSALSAQETLNHHIEALRRFITRIFSRVKFDSVGVLLEEDADLPDIKDINSYNAHMNLVMRRTTKAATDQLLFDGLRSIIGQELLREKWAEKVDPINAGETKLIHFLNRYRGEEKFAVKVVGAKRKAESQERKYHNQCRGNVVFIIP
jgi:hypothetical protein